ncbi:hypothetical protein EMCRGX_G011908 [Ephydatia muelleri]|eukprot:Em0006g553a
MPMLMVFGLFIPALFVVANSQLLLSPTSFTVLENSSFIVTCTHAAGAEVLLTGLISAYDIILPPASNTVTTFNISRVSRLDYNKQFTCTQSNVPPSSPANLTVIFFTAQPQFSSDLVVVSAPGDFFLNISIAANPFVIPEGLTVQTPPGVTLPAFNVIGINTTGTVYIKLDLFKLFLYAGSYAVTLRHPAVSTNFTIQFNLTVLYAPRYTASATPNATVDVYVLPGNPRILSCAATGVPTPSIVGVNSSSFTISTNSYNIASASVSDAGLYICEASNAIGLNAITYRLNIGASPSPTTSPSPTPTKSGASALNSTFLCIVIICIMVVLF